MCGRHRGTIIKRANRYIAFRGEESTVAENKEYFPEKNKEYSNKYKKKISAYKKNFEVLFRAHFFFTQNCTSKRTNSFHIWEVFILLKSSAKPWIDCLNCTILFITIGPLDVVSLWVWQFFSVNLCCRFSESKDQPAYLHDLHIFDIIVLWFLISS